MARPSDTIAALATPAGASALAVIRTTGPDTRGLAGSVFGEAPPPRAVRRGRYRDRTGATVDDVLFTFFSGPESYTGEDVLEISSHGNPFIAQKILEDLLARGCRPAEPGEFTRRAFLNGRLDLSQAEAVMDVIHARGERALAAAQRLLDGALGRHMRPLTDELLGAIARVEAHIDFPDEDLPPEDGASLRGTLESIAEGTTRLLATQRYGEQLRDGIKTVIVGEPNVGKSSLLNRLIGRERAIVSPEPGTTRDFIEERVIVGPHCLRLIDTAGLNSTPAALERLGIEKTYEQIAEADMILLVQDGSLPAPPLNDRLKARLTPQNTLLVLNKADLLAGTGGPSSAKASAGRPPELAAVAVSALTGSGIDELTAAISRLADSFQQTVGAEGIAINARHAHALAQAKDCLSAALGKLKSDEPTELLASDLRGALEAFGDISGKIDNERMLDRLFASFCIGK